MDDRKPHSINRPNRPVRAWTRTATRISGYLAGKPKPIKTTKVDPGKERLRRLMWWLKWVFLIPLSAYALVWLVVIFIDLFKY